MNMPALPLARSEQEIQDGIASVTKALGGTAPAPFFRLPGFARSEPIEKYLASQRDHAVEHRRDRRRLEADLVG